MLPLYRDPHFTFRFAEDRLVDRFHLDGVAPGTPVSVFALDPATGEYREFLAEGVAGAGGWVDRSERLVVRAGGGFVAVAGAFAVRGGTPAVTVGPRGSRDVHVAKARARGA